MHINSLRYRCPETGDTLALIDDKLVSPQGRSYPICRGIPRFVETKNYADAFGEQWNRFRKTQLDSYSGLSHSEDRLARCMRGHLADVPKLADMRACLASGFPFVFGFSVYESFESDAVAASGVVPLPDRGERVLGGHAVCAVGYDDKARRFTVRNSWGREWGQKGYCTMPYAYLDNDNLAGDLWTMRKLAG